MNLRALWQTWTRHLVGEAAARDQPVQLVEPPALTTGFGRRRFLGLVLGGAAGAAIASTVDLDQLLWMPGEKTILIPEVVEGALVNSFLFMDWLTKETLHLLTQRLDLAPFFNDQVDHRHGDTINIRQWSCLGDSLVAPSKPVTLDHAFGLWFAPAPREQRYTERQARLIFAKPAAAALARKIREDRLDVFGNLPIINLPPDVDVTSVSDPSTGLALCGMRYFDPVRGEFQMRMGMLGGRRVLQRVTPLDP